MEAVGEWKARVYEMHNVVFTFRSRKVNASSENREDPCSPTCILPLEIDEDSDDEFIVAENPRFSVSGDRQRRHSSFTRDERELVTVSRKSVDIIPAESRRVPTRAVDRLVAPPRTKDKEYTKSLRPTVWLTEQFPLKTEELMPLLDILANKIKAVRRMREVLLTTFPSGTFPIKVSIPVVPTVRVVITFTKFVDLKPTEEFHTPLSSPSQFAEDDHHQDSSSSNNESTEDPFTIPTEYSWSSFNDKSRKMRRSNSKRSTKKK